MSIPWRCFADIARKMNGCLFLARHASAQGINTAAISSFDDAHRIDFNQRLVVAVDTDDLSRS